MILRQVKAVAEEMGIGFLGIGFQPKWERNDIPIMPKVWLMLLNTWNCRIGQQYTQGYDTWQNQCRLLVLLSLFDYNSFFLYPTFGLWYLLFSLLSPFCKTPICALSAFILLIWALLKILINLSTFTQGYCFWFWFLFVLPARRITKLGKRTYLAH